MNIAESAGHAAALAIQNKVAPASLNSDLLQRKLASSHVMISFFNDLDVSARDPRIPAAQYFATKGFFADYNARLDAPLKESTLAAWGRGLTALREGTLKPMDLLKQVKQAESEASPAIASSRGEVLLSMWTTLATAQPKATGQP